MDKKLIALMLVFMLAFGLFTTITVFNKPLTKLTKAKEESIVSPDSSLIFAWPLSTTTNATTPVQINVFVRNANNVPLQNKKVGLTTTLGTVKEVNATTDQAGKATFNLQSATQGIAEVTATVDNQIQLKQKISVKFE